MANSSEKPAEPLRLSVGILRAIISRFIRFGFIGAWNTGLSAAVYVLSLYLGAPYYLAVLVTNVAAVVNNYLTFRFFVFGDRPRAPVLRYLFGFAVNYAFTVAAVGFFADIIGMNDYFAGFAALPFVAVFSFALNNWFVFYDKEK